MKPSPFHLDVAQQMLGTPAVESAIEKFEQDWNAAFGTEPNRPPPAITVKEESNGPHYSITGQIHPGR